MVMEALPPPARLIGCKGVPRFMVATSILFRGPGSSSDTKNVYIVDEPRNTIDFLHRAARTGRAGQAIFEGRGSQRAKDTKQKRSFYYYSIWVAV